MKDDFPERYFSSPDLCVSCGHHCTPTSVVVDCDGIRRTMTCNHCNDVFAQVLQTRRIGSAAKAAKEPSFATWVFPSGDLMICTPGKDGGTVVEPELFPAFDLTDDTGATTWCVRHCLTGGDSEPVAEVFSGTSMTLLSGLCVDGVRLNEGVADSMQHEVAGYMAALFSMAPAMQKFIRDIAEQTSDPVLESKATQLMDELVKRAKDC